MFPAVATGARNPDPGMTAAAMSVTQDHDTPQSSFPPYGPDALARQIVTALERCRRLGHRDPSVTLTRPTAVVEGVQGLLRDAGLRPSVKPAGVGGCLVLTVRG